METCTEVITGTCQYMCPKPEMIMREREGLLHIFESETDDLDGSNQRRRFKADPSKVIKQFSRPAAGKAETNPSDLRPAPVLRDTVSYLYESIIPKNQPAWFTVYEFVFDRLRAVRQDMVIQGIVGKDAIVILEQVVRFHLYASYRLRNANFADFDPVINKQHLLECLKRLLYLYKVTPGPHENRVEFESIYLLDNLGDPHAMTHFFDLDPITRKSPLLHKCYEISSAYMLRNYVRVLKLVWTLPSIMCLCAVNPHLFTVRINFLQILSSGYSVKNCQYPLTELRARLYLDSDQETLDLCSLCGLVDFFDKLPSDFICFHKTNYQKPKEEKTPCSLPMLAAMFADTSVSSLLLGRCVDSQGKPPCSDKFTDDVKTTINKKKGNEAGCQVDKGDNTSRIATVQPVIGRGRGRGRGRSKENVFFNQSNKFKP